MTRLIPETLTARTIIVLVVGLMGSHLLSMVFYFADRSEAVELSNGAHLGEHIATIKSLVEHAAEAEWARIVARVSAPHLRVRRAMMPPPRRLAPADPGKVPPIVHAVRASLERGGLREAATSVATVAPMPAPAGPSAARRAGGKTATTGARAEGARGEALLVSVPLRDGSWLLFTAPLGEEASHWSFRFVFSMLVMLGAVAILACLVVNRLTAPLKGFADAALRLGRDVHAPPLPENGPLEVRRASHAFNQMQARIQRFVEDRTRMLAAIAHDLGTPITRLRLRAELVEDAVQRRKMLEDLEHMEKMISSVLSFARGEAGGEAAVVVDLGPLLQRVCDDLTDTGAAVELTLGRRAMPYRCRPVALRRALTNVIENAAKYGKRAKVAASDDGDRIVIRIDDEGPGIDEALREHVFRPFQRLETSRNPETGGTGLGLTVARSIVRGHGGEIALGAGPGGGLRVEITLPRA